MLSINNFLQNNFVIADKICDYIPFYSHYNNAICLIVKGMLYGMELYASSVYAKIQDSHLLKHLQQKTVYQCALLSIPFLNICVAIVRDCPDVRDCLENVFIFLEPTLIKNRRELQRLNAEKKQLIKELQQLLKKEKQFISQQDKLDFQVRIKQTQGQENLNDTEKELIKMYESFAV